MKIPNLTQPMTLEEALRVSDGAGGYTETWVGLGVVWAHIRAGSGREKADASATISSVPYRITVRAAPHGATNRPRADQRFRLGARLFNIVAVIEADSAGRHLVCHAVEEVSV